MTISLLEWNGVSLEVSGWADSIGGAILVTTGEFVRDGDLDKVCIEEISRSRSFLYGRASDGTYYYHHLLSGLKEELKQHEESILVRGQDTPT